MSGVGEPVSLSSIAASRVTPERVVAGQVTVESVRAGAVSSASLSDGEFRLSDLGRSVPAPGRARSKPSPVRPNHPRPVGGHRRFPMTVQERRDRRARVWSLVVGAVLCTGFGSVVTLIVQAVA